MFTPATDLTFSTIFYSPLPKNVSGSRFNSSKSRGCLHRTPFFKAPRSIMVAYEDGEMFLFHYSDARMAIAALGSSWLLKG